MNKKLLILAADFYPQIAEMLRAGARLAVRNSAFEAEELPVPGALELPQALNFAAGKYQGYVVLGCVIKGETDHYRLVVSRCSQGVSTVALRHNLAVGFGVITAASKAQALKRAEEPPGRNLGFSAAEACLRLVALKAGLAKRR